MIPIVGDGGARTNPVHQADVAELIRHNIRSGPKEVAIGGPEILTRRGIAELAFQALGMKPRLIRMSPRFLHRTASVMKFWNPRMAELTHFGAEVSTHECIAPAIGIQRLEDYFRKVAK